jgi:hypothetical protein
LLASPKLFSPGGDLRLAAAYLLTVTVFRLLKNEGTWKSWRQQPLRREILPTFLKTAADIVGHRSNVRDLRKFHPPISATSQTSPPSSSSSSFKGRAKDH